jgi:hypothetical protein
MNVRTLTVLLIAFVTALAVSMQEAHAYLTPEAVFGTDGSTTVTTGGDAPHGAASSSSSGFDRTDPDYLPPNQRAAENERALQESQRDYQYADIQDIPVHAAAPAEDTSPARNLLDENYQYELRQQRLLEQQQNGGGNVTIVIDGDGAVTADGTVLKSAAPRVTATGPTTVLMSILLIVAALSTVVYARIRERQMA